MVQMTMQVSEELATRLRLIGRWLPTVLELSLVGFKTLATATATEVIEFLSTEPTPQDVLNYHVCEHAQARLQGLLALKCGQDVGGSRATGTRLRSQDATEHIIIMLKAQVTGLC